MQSRVSLCLIGALQPITSLQLQTVTAVAGGEEDEEVIVDTSQFAIPLRRFRIVFTASPKTASDLSSAFPV